MRPYTWAVALPTASHSKLATSGETVCDVVYSGLLSEICANRLLTLERRSNAFELDVVDKALTIALSCKL